MLLALDIKQKLALRFGTRAHIAKFVSSQYWKEFPNASRSISSKNVNFWKWWISRYDDKEEATWGRPRTICCCNNYLTTSETCEITPGWHDAYFILAILKIFFETLWMSGRCGNLPITGFIWRAHLKKCSLPIFQFNLTFVKRKTLCRMRWTLK